MKKPFYLLIFVLALALAYAASQTSSSGSSPSQTPAQPPSTNQTTPATTAATAPDSQTSSGAGGELQGQIQNALKNEPTLANDNISVSVTDTEIDLSGTVASGKEKLTAKRIAQSYAGNRKVKEHLTMSGQPQK